jgi:drug/metabolite transporter (DMT)-like permease
VILDVVAAHFLYMVLSSLAFAGLDLVRKLLAGRIDALALVLFMSLGAVPLLGILLALNGVGPLSRSYLLPGLSALVLNFLASLGFIYSVKLSPLSRTIPLLSLTPAFTALTAIPLLGEYPDRRQMAGIVLVVCGAIALNARGPLTGVVRGFFQEKGAPLMTAVAMMWAISGPLDKRAIAHASVYFHATVMSFGVGVGALAVLFWQERLGVLRRSRGEAKLLFAAMVAITLALTFQLLAIRGVFVSLVEAFKRAVGSVMAVILGRLVFRESVGAREWIAVLVMTAGVFLILT